MNVATVANVAITSSYMNPQKPELKLETIPRSLLRPFGLTMATLDPSLSLKPQQNPQNIAIISLASQ